MFSKSTEYALRATIFIARRASEEKKISVRMVAEGIGAPTSFTAKIVQLLSKKGSGIITSVSGPTGGLYITKADQQQPIIRVVELMGEMNVIENCILGFPNCSDKTPCSMHKNFKTIRKDIIHMFSEKSIEKLANSRDTIM